VPIILLTICCSHFTYEDSTGLYSGTQYVDTSGLTGDIIDYAFSSGGDSGYIIIDTGDGETPDPIPEPATMLLFCLGLLCVAGVSRKKTA
jgi:hypothetical protein